MNGLLVLLVLGSVLLSFRLLFPPEEMAMGEGNASVQSPLPEWQTQMPDVYRPERIYIQPDSTKTALLAAGSEPYSAMWAAAQEILTGLEPDWDAVTTGTEHAAGGDITLVLPAPLTLTDWAEVWGWDTPTSSLSSIQIDRVRLQTGSVSAVTLSGPDGFAYTVAFLSEEQTQALQEQVADLDSALFVEQRPLNASSLRILPGLTVPVLDSVPWARVSARNPDSHWEGSSYFPDPSVVREIDERYAQSFTDGQRLLRITTSGVMEYRAADALGTAPALYRAQRLVRDWVGARGGWPEDIVLVGYSRQEGTTSLTYEMRLPGPLPVETANGALQIEVTAGLRGGQPDTVVALRRYPQLLPAFDSKVMLSVIPAEEAVAVAEKTFPSAMLQEMVRDCYLAYLVQPGTDPGDVGWQIEPVWVIQAGEVRVYIPALSDSVLQPFEVGAANQLGG